MKMKRLVDNRDKKLTQHNYLKYLNKIVKVEIDRPLGSCHPRHRFKYGVNYGFIPKTKGSDGEEIDAYVLGVDRPLKEYTGICVAIIHRLDDNDDKLIILPEGEKISNQAIRKATFFQEKYFKSVILR